MPQALVDAPLELLVEPDELALIKQAAAYPAYPGGGGRAP